MKQSTTWLLARPQHAAARTRTRLVAAGCAAAGALVMAVVAVLRVPAVFAGEPGRPVPRLSPLVAEAGLRPGTVTGIVLLVVPTLALVWQAVTVGSARRQVVHDALSVAGATPADLRRVAAVDAGAAGLLGGLLAGPAYLLLWLVLGLASPPSTRLLPALSAVDLLSWLSVTGLTVLVAAAAGMRAVTPNRRRPVRPWWRMATLVAALAIIVVSIGASGVGREAQVALVGAGCMLLVIAVLAGGSWWVGRRARRLARSGRPVDILAAAGLRALAGPAGRTAGAVFAAGITLGIAASLLGILTADPYVGDLSFHLPALALTAVAALLAVLVAVAAMTLAAADDLVTTRRGLAAVAALGAEPVLLEQVQRRRLEVITATPMVAGVLLGGLFFSGLGALHPAALLRVWPVLVAAALALVGARLLCAGVVRALRGRLRQAAAASSLRVA